MKLTITEAGKAGLPFPKYMWSGCQTIIILMTDANKGTVVYSDNDSYNVGFYSDIWFSTDFTDFKGEIKIEQ